MPRTTGTSYVSTPAAKAMMRNLAINVRGLRQAHGWTFKQLSSLCGLPWRTIECIEQENNTPSFVAVAWLAEAFDITITRLVYYPMEAIEGRARDQKTGKFIVPDTGHWSGR